MSDFNDGIEKLKPCPFCGKQPVTFGSGDGQRRFMIECMTDGCVNPHVSNYDHATAKKVWNTRFIPDEALEKIARIIAPIFSRSAFDSIGNWLDRQVRSDSLTAAERILATGLVQDEASIRADEREKCAVYIEQRPGSIPDRQEIAAAIRKGGTHD